MTTAAPGSEPRRILLSGATGLIGRRFAAERRAAGDRVVALVRRPAGGDEIRWDPGVGEGAGEGFEALDPALVSGFDAVVHLAGEPVVGRWTAAKKRKILESRVAGTTALARALAAAEQPPGVFLCASGINFYGGTRAGEVDESSTAGSGFLAEVCEAWEAACDPLRAVTRVVNLRIGVVLAAEGGTLAAMLPLFRLGLGGSVGPGEGIVSWISIGDLVRAMEHVLTAEELRGPVNAVAPEPVTGRRLTKAVAAAVRRPAVLTVPAWLARLVMGGFAEETALGSVRAMPRRLMESGFVFRDVRIEEALAGIVST